ncbi:HD domain-containing phosphohydrolase [Pseudoalteromonas piratica]|uniref:HD domain-containing phosphohydrolase n=1 Tax=Pseudoalteromonas piratica TaxID=1348114 RepID=UPI0006904C04|nr:HD domain-containing phosphohydrolase [Pseudoalteromonas piratica]
MEEACPLTLFSRRRYLSSRDVYQSFLETILQLSGSQIGYLHLVNQDEIALTVWSQKVFEMCSTVHANHYKLSEAGIWADSIRQLKPVIHNNYQDIDESQKNGLPAGHFPVISHVSFPILKKAQVIAVLGIGNSDLPYEQSFVEEINEKINRNWHLVEEKIASTEQIESQLLARYESMPKQEVLLKMLSALSNAFELRDEYTSEHQRNVSIIASKIARTMELPERIIEAVTIGGLVHDIGKIVVPSEILNKARKLMPAEMELIKLHPKMGADIFRDIDLPFHLTEMIEQHHERLDGSGYPNGLKGEDISLEARIIAVADTFDAMASDRPYRYSPGREAAVAELKANRNIKYDVYVVDAFLELLETDPDLQPGLMHA